jgi:molybdate transport system permease protein
MDWQAIWLTAKLATLVSLILLVVSLPLAHWLIFSRRRWKFLVEAVVSLPLILPPTVLGFYLLVAMGSRSPIGRWWAAWSGHSLAFTFEGLVLASILYSLPFAVQPLAAAFAQVDPSLREASATLGASPLRTFMRVTLPLSIEGAIAGMVLSFAHTVGEFGGVLMGGGNLPGITRTVSISIYDNVQGLQYAEANQTAVALLAFSFGILLLVYGLRRRPWAAVSLT